MDFSLVSCTYNPDSSIFPQVLESCSELEYDQDLYEILIIDNSSDVLVTDLHYIQKLRKRKNVRFIREDKQGLTHARMRGFAESKGEFIVFVDDDNKLDSNYLIGAKKLIERNSMIRGVGPGRIQVVFRGRYPSKYESYFKNVFQEKNLKTAIVTNYSNSQDNTLFGSGMIVHREVLTEYLRLVKEGKLSATDRYKSSLVSSGDYQITSVLTSMGYLMAFDPGIALDHIIAERKSCFKYLKKLLYSVARYGLASQVEISKLQNREYEINVTSGGAFAISFLIIIVTSVITRDFALINSRISQLIGSAEAQYLHVKNRLPVWLKFLKIVFGLNSF